MSMKVFQFFSKRESKQSDTNALCETKFELDFPNTQISFSVQCAFVDFSNAFQTSVAIFPKFKAFVSFVLYFQDHKIF